jgi:hypothetical protein
MSWRKQWIAVGVDAGKGMGFVPARSEIRAALKSEKKMVGS